jgi:uncharacterized membrane protein
MVRRLVPPLLPGSARTWTLGSGVVELLVAAAVAAPRTRRAGGWPRRRCSSPSSPATSGWRSSRGRVPRWAALARLPLQVPLVLWGLQVAEKLPSTGRRA